MKKEIVTRNLQANLNEYKKQAWFKKEKCKFVKIWDDVEYFEKGNVQGHFGRLFKEPDTLYIIIRGSDEKADWFYNWKFFLKKIKTGKAVKPYAGMRADSKIKVHEGFILSYMTVREFFTNKAKEFEKVVIIGHSYGSALSVLLALDLQARKIIDRKNLMVFAFSTPKVGNSYFTKSYNKRVPFTFGYYLDGDIIVKNPPWFLGYRKIAGMKPVDKLNYFNPWNWFAGLVGVPSRHYPNKLLDKIEELL